MMPPPGRSRHWQLELELELIILQFMPGPAPAAGAAFPARCHASGPRAQGGAALVPGCCDRTATGTAVPGWTRRLGSSGPLCTPPQDQQAKFALSKLLASVAQSRLGPPSSWILETKHTPQVDGRPTGIWSLLAGADSESYFNNRE